MKSKIILLSTLLLSLVFYISCSSPAPQTFETDDSEPVDITAQADSTIPQTDETQVDDTTMQSFKTVPKADIPKCLAQIETVKTVLAKVVEDIAKFGQTKYLYEDNNQVFLNTKLLTDNGGLASPIPLFISWDSSKIEGLAEVESWISGNSSVKVKGIRRADDGNWYHVTNGTGTLNELEGWIHEVFLSTFSQSDPSFRGVESPPDENGGGGRGGGRRGGGGRPPGGGG